MKKFKVGDRVRCIRVSGTDLNGHEIYTVLGISPSGDLRVHDPDFGGWVADRFETVNTTKGGTKHDSNKPRMELLPQEALEEIAKVLTFGAKKYDDNNWRKGFDYSRLIGASLRHIAAFQQNENTDPESGESHLAHAACCLLFLITHEKLKLGVDDRWKQGS